MDDYNVMLVTIARSATENGTYIPGVEGVDPSQNLNQTRILWGQDDDERDLINTVRTQKRKMAEKLLLC